MSEFAEALGGRVIATGLSPHEALVLYEKRQSAISEARSKNVYELFIGEMDALSIGAALSAAEVVGLLTRAVKRAQMVFDGELEPVDNRD